MEKRSVRTFDQYIFASVTFCVLSFSETTYDISYEYTSGSLVEILFV